ncbi:TM2 domain-containing protein 1 [Chanos chanos]|uniref:TM2 domain-containing protein 1 n=1 Tax=Chanos chanos TaxID=29144 RepID=A0A6J2WTX9_CHACN|nr:TM2 domain-containing protein 1 [Chanos chanos]
MRSLPLVILLSSLCWNLIYSFADDVDNCENLRLGQYRCKDPVIDDATQEPQNCKDSLAWVECCPAPNVSCRLANGTTFKFSGEEVGFNKSIPCRNVSGYSYKVAVALSLFLGWLGADRFYLGYPALGLLKFCTVGFCGIGSLVDFMLISMQIVGPSDGSDYIVDYYGARLTRLSITNETYRRTQLS